MSYLATVQDASFNKGFDFKGALQYLSELDDMNYEYVDEESLSNILYERSYMLNYHQEDYDGLAKFGDGCLSFLGEGNDHWELVLKNGETEEICGEVVYREHQFYVINFNILKFAVFTDENDYLHSLRYANSDTKPYAVCNSLKELANVLNSGTVKREAYRPDLSFETDEEGEA